MSNFIKGFIIGVLKIVPGVSGSMMAICFGVYERTLKIISNIGKINFSDFIFLLELSLGLLIGVSLFSNIILVLLDCFYFSVMFLFLGLIIGTIPGFIKKSISSFNYVIVCVSFILSLLFFYGVSFFKFDLSSDYFSFFIIGILEVFSSIVPGVSGTAIFTSLGCYDIILSFFSNVFNPQYFGFGLFFTLGIVFGLVIFSKVITFLFDKYRCIMNLVIFGLVLSSIFTMFIQVLFVPFSIGSFIIGIIFLCIGFFISYFLSNKLSI